ncbi:hypothetical protein, partial [uncultured Desulfovibrio sp.]|uniref:hypothetical protein n=1 Tax=uncultured Desulfovibrio sp. TaxID=167968 RepID=UPI00262F09FB
FLPNAQGEKGERGGYCRTTLFLRRFPFNARPPACQLSASEFGKKIFPRHSPFPSSVCFSYFFITKNILPFFYRTPARSASAKGNMGGGARPEASGKTARFPRRGRPYGLKRGAFQTKNK